MAEQIISPGVFTKENDLSFIAQGVEAIGAAIVGPTVKGPAFHPTICRNFADYERKFGGLSKDTFVPQTVREYIKSAGAVTVVRVLAGEGWKLLTTNSTAIAVGLSMETNTIAAAGKMIVSDGNASTVTGAAGGGFTENESFTISDGFGVTQKFVITDDNVNGAAAAAATGVILAADSVTGASVAGTAGVGAIAVSVNLTGSTTTYRDFMVQVKAAIEHANSPFKAGSVHHTITVGTVPSEVDGEQFTTLTFPVGIPTHPQEISGDISQFTFEIETGTEASSDVQLVGLLLPSMTTTAIPDLELSTQLASSSLEQDSFDLTLNGTGVNTKTVKASLNPANSNYLFKQLGYKPTVSKTGAVTFAGTPAYTYLEFKNLLTSAVAGTATNMSTTGSIVISEISSDVVYSGGDKYDEKYSYASTPMITSGFLDPGKDSTKAVQDLFEFHTLSHGVSTNKDYKISISNLKSNPDIDGVEQYGSFTVNVRKYDDKDKSPNILESYTGCNLNPDDGNYIGRKIGDRYSHYNTTLSKLEILGSFNNMSNYVRVKVNAAVEDGSTSPSLLPKGFKAVMNPFPMAACDFNTFPSASYESSQAIGGNYNTRAHLGWKFDDKATDNSNFCMPLSDTDESNGVGPFNLDNHVGHLDSGLAHSKTGNTTGGALSASIDVTGAIGPTSDQLKFSVPFQGGDDGIAPWLPRFTGAESTLATTYATTSSPQNLYGFDLSGTDKKGYTGYKKALDILSNQDEYDINMLALPGVIKEYHSNVTQAAIDMVETRGDAFYVMDLCNAKASVNTALSKASGIDTNYAAVYYPWVKVQGASKPIFVPPSVIVPGAIAKSDQIGQGEWFAPAGLNRGLLGNVIEAKIRLNQGERDRLYDNKINPIASFPGVTSPVIWGQKTLQSRSTALDRINVRRLLIAVKKFIASSSKYLVFEANTTKTRARFLNIVNPYLEGIQQRQGLFAFRVQMDGSNNTPDVIDRNQLVGGIYLQPTKTAEFILLDFNILPTGATFDA